LVTPTENQKQSRNQVEEIQQDATGCRYLFTAKLLYMFRTSIVPSSAVHKIVVADSGTDHTIWGASFFKRDHLIWSRLRKLAPKIV